MAALIALSLGSPAFPAAAQTKIDTCESLTLPRRYVLVHVPIPMGNCIALRAGNSWLHLEVAGISNEPTRPEPTHTEIFVRNDTMANAVLDFVSDGSAQDVIQRSAVLEGNLGEGAVDAIVNDRMAGHDGGTGMFVEGWNPLLGSTASPDATRIGVGPRNIIGDHAVGVNNQAGRASTQGAPSLTPSSGVTLWTLPASIGSSLTVPLGVGPR